MELHDFVPQRLDLLDNRSGVKTEEQGTITIRLGRYLGVYINKHDLSLNSRSKGGHQWKPFITPTRMRASNRRSDN